MEKRCTIILANNEMNKNEDQFTSIVTEAESRLDALSQSFKVLTAYYALKGSSQFENQIKNEVNPRDFIDSLFESIKATHFNNTPDFRHINENREEFAFENYVTYSYITVNFREEKPSARWEGWYVWDDILRNEEHLMSFFDMYTASAKKALDKGFHHPYVVSVDYNGENIL